ncbi:MAG: hypothetical protein WCX65_19305 [bacterium]
MKMRTAKIAAALLICATAAVMFSGCPKKPADRDGQRKIASRVGGDDIAALENQSRFKNRAELRSYLASKIVCPVHNMNLVMDEKSVPSCENRQKIMMTIDRMMDTGWSIEEIEASIPLIQQGVSMISDMANEQSCEPAGGALRLDFFLMSHCPYGLRYVDQILPSMLAEFGQLLIWEPHFIVDFDAQGKISSLHGQPEIDEDMFQICIAREIGNATWLSYARCYASEINREYANAQNGGKQPDQKTIFNKVHTTCAAKAGVSIAATDSCVNSKAAGYLKKDSELAKRWDTMASPSAVFNCNKKFNGGAVPYTQAKPFICGIFPENARPPVCEKL